MERKHVDDFVSGFNTRWETQKAKLLRARDQKGTRVCVVLHGPMPTYDAKVGGFGKARGFTGRSRAPSLAGLHAGFGPLFRLFRLLASLNYTLQNPCTHCLARNT